MALNILNHLINRGNIFIVEIHLFQHIPVITITNNPRKKLLNPKDQNTLLKVTIIKALAYNNF